MEDKTLTILLTERLNQCNIRIIDELKKQQKLIIALGSAIAELNAVQEEKIYSIKDFYKGEI